ncbi:MAG: type VI secretion system contractile sheath small subunit, partial [Gemmataceae bacterium]
MATPFSFGSIRIGIGPDKGVAGVSDETPFRILVLGDFTGRASRGVCEALAGRKPILLDRDNFEEVMGKLKIDLQLSLGASGRVAMSFLELVDFRP